MEDGAMVQAQPEHPMIFKGDGGDFFGIWVVNCLLTVVTLGIYSAWAKVRTKRYFYGNTFIDGDNFEYHAKPIQLLKGRIVALILVLIWFVASSFFPVVSSILLVAFSLVMPWLLWSNARFDARMTSFRNVHFDFSGTLAGAYKAILGRGLIAFSGLVIGFVIASAAMAASELLGLFLMLATFVVGVLLYGWFIAGIERYFVNGYRYGDYHFSAELATHFYMKLYAKASSMAMGVFLLFGLVVGGTFFAVFASSFDALDNGDAAAALGVALGMFVFYIVMILTGVILNAYTTTRARNYLFEQVKIQRPIDEQAIFGLRSLLTVGGYMKLVVINFLILVISFGFARPFVMVRTTRYLAERTRILGDMNQLSASGDEHDEQSAITDEVVQAFDLGIGLG